MLGNTPPPMGLAHISTALRPPAPPVEGKLAIGCPSLQKAATASIAQTSRAYTRPNTLTVICACQAGGRAGRWLRAPARGRHAARVPEPQPAGTRAHPLAAAADPRVRGPHAACLAARLCAGLVRACGRLARLGGRPGVTGRLCCYRRCCGPGPRGRCGHA